MPELSLGRHRRTSSLTWLTAVACAIVSTAIIIGGIFVTVIYVIYHPKVPFLAISSSQLLRLDNNPSGSLAVKIALNVVATNPNARSHASFSNLGMCLRFGGTVVAELRSAPFDVPKHGSFPLAYVVDSWPLPLGAAARAELDTALRRHSVGFELEGRARTRWRVGILLRLGFWTHVSCRLRFFPSNGTSIQVDCSSKSHL